jgi:hypothetical protein
MFSPRGMTSRGQELIDLDSPCSLMMRTSNISKLSRRQSLGPMAIRSMFKPKQTLENENFEYHFNLVLNNEETSRALEKYLKQINSPYEKGFRYIQSVADFKASETSVKAHKCEQIIKEYLGSGSTILDPVLRNKIVIQVRNSKDKIHPDVFDESVTFLLDELKYVIFIPFINSVGFKKLIQTRGSELIEQIAHRTNQRIDIKYYDIKLSIQEIWYETEDVRKMTCLYDHKLNHLVRLFSIHDFSSDTVEFICQVMDFMNETSEQSRLVIAKHIYEQHIADGSLLQIGLTNEIKEQIYARITDRDIDSDLFDKALAIAIIDMRDILGRFVNSKEYSFYKLTKEKYEDMKHRIRTEERKKEPLRKRIFGKLK